MTAPRSGTLSGVVRGHPFRVVAYYVVASAAVLGVWAALPEAAQRQVSEVLWILNRPAGAVAEAGHASKGALAAAPVPPSSLPAAAAAIIAAVGALLLSLPVAWTYMFTRQRKGYNQSVVHTLVLLPLVVAGVVVLVKDSLALAFGLAGVVAAVRFRNTLDDSRDAVFIFFSTSIGLAAAVHLDVAVALSVLFNLVVFGLFFTDFGRTPPALEGIRAQRELEKALKLANRTSMFVSQVDQQILQELAPQQLEALADRLSRRREELGDIAPPPERFDRRLLVTTAEPDALRLALEPVLEAHTKRWRFTSVTPTPEGAHVVEYAVKLRKSQTPGTLMSAVRVGGANHVTSVELA